MSIRQIAKLAKVSPSAASLALRGSSKISPATRARVLRAAKRVGYKPNARIAELMAHLRLARRPESEGCFGVISFYPEPKPWEKSVHLLRLHQAMQTRAESFGYSLEPFWLRAPDMNHRRIRTILDTRGIKGLLCFGSPDMDEDFPSAFDHYAIVTQGLSIRTPLHRVINHAYSDTYRALTKVYQMGYRRPGLVLGQYEDIRRSHLDISAYLGWSQQNFGIPMPIPVLRLDRIEKEPLMSWVRQHHPDVIILVHRQEALEPLMAALAKGRYRVPQDIGVAALCQVLRDTGISGMEENQRLLGAWAVELLIGRIMSGDLGIPVHPRIELVESQWVDGTTLRPQSV